MFEAMSLAVPRALTRELCGGRPAYCHTFATVYVLMLWTSEETNQLVMRRAVREALPRIEALTPSLSPISGPSGARGAAAMTRES